MCPLLLAAVIGGPVPPSALSVALPVEADAATRQKAARLFARIATSLEAAK
jgi:hypothetical protein